MTPIYRETRTCDLNPSIDLLTETFQSFGKNFRHENHKIRHISLLQHALHVLQDCRTSLTSECSQDYTPSLCLSCFLYRPVSKTFHRLCVVSLYCNCSGIWIVPVLLVFENVSDLSYCIRRFRSRTLRTNTPQHLGYVSLQIPSEIDRLPRK